MPYRLLAEENPSLQTTQESPKFESLFAQHFTFDFTLDGHSYQVKPEPSSVQIDKKGRISLELSVLNPKIDGDVQLAYLHCEFQRTEAGLVLQALSTGNNSNRESYRYNPDIPRIKGLVAKLITELLDKGKIVEWVSDVSTSPAAKNMYDRLEKTGKFTVTREPIAENSLITRFHVRKATK